MNTNEKYELGTCSICGKKAKEVGSHLFCCEKDQYAFFDYPSILEKLNCCKGPDKGPRQLGDLWILKKKITKCDFDTFLNYYLDGHGFICSYCGHSYSTKVVKEYYDQAEMEDIKNEAREYIDKIGKNPPKSSFSFDGIENIKGSQEGLKKYIWKALEVEQGVYMLEQRITQLFLLESELDKSIANGMDVIDEDTEKEKLKVLEFFDKKKKNIDEDEYSLKKTPMPEKPEKPNDFTGTLPKEPQYMKSNIFNRKKIETKNMDLKREYDEAILKYEEQRREYEKSLEKYSEELKEYEDTRKNIEERNCLVAKKIEEKRKEELLKAKKERDERIAKINEENYAYKKNYPKVLEKNMALEELDMCANALKELLAFREKYYSTEIVFQKYRTIPALSTIYEYLSSGRCDTLEGKDGGYNLYESEIRANRVIDQLDTVIERLDEIRNNQDTLSRIMQGACDRLDAVNEKMKIACASLDKLGKQVVRVIRNTEDIAKNTSVSAYYAERAAHYSKITSTIAIASFIGL